MYLSSGWVPSGFEQCCRFPVKVRETYLGANVEARWRRGRGVSGRFSQRLIGWTGMRKRVNTVRDCPGAAAPLGGEGVGRRLESYWASALETRLCMKWLSILITPGKKDSKSVSRRKFPKATGIDTHVEIAHAGMFYWRTILISLLSGAPISTQKWRYSRLLEHQQIIGASCFWMSFFLFCC